MKRYRGKHVKKKSHSDLYESILIIFVAFSLFCSAGLMARADEEVEVPIEVILSIPTYEIPRPEKFIPVFASSYPNPHEKDEPVDVSDDPELASDPNIKITDEYLEPYKELVSEEDATRIAKCVMGEFNRADEPVHVAAVVWCILNRYDAGYGDFSKIVTKSQFHGYDPNNWVNPGIYDIVVDTMARWYAEKDGWDGHVNRVLPKDYLWFTGCHPDGLNWYRNEYKARTYWDWSEVF